MFDDMSIDEVVWDEEPQQLDGEMDDPLECKHTMFKVATVSNSDAQKVLDEMPRVVLWDEDGPSELHMNSDLLQSLNTQDDLLQHLSQSDLDMDAVQEELEQSDVEMVDLMQCKQVVWDDELIHEQQEAGFDKYLVAYTKETIDLVISDLLTHDSDMDTADILFNDMPLEVRWDEEMERTVDQHGLLKEQHGLLKELAQGGCHVGENKFMFKAPVALNRVVHEVPSQVVWDEVLFQSPNSEEDLLLLSSEPAIIAEHVDSQNDLLQKVSQFEVYSKINNDNPLDESGYQPSTKGARLEDTSIPLSPINKWSDSGGGLDSVELHMTRAQICHVETSLTDEDNLKYDLGAARSTHQLPTGSHGIFSPGEGEQQLELYRMTDTQWDPGLCAQDYKYRADADFNGPRIALRPLEKALMLQIQQYLSANGTERIIVLKEIRLSLVPCMLWSNTNDDAAEVLVEIFGQAVWGEMPTAISTHHGLVHYSIQSGDYFGDEKKIESVDPVTSRGASHVMFHAMTCTDMVWNDDLLNGHEYQKPVVSTIAAMSRICVDLDKHKTYGLNRCKKLQVYLNNSEVFAKMYFRVVWASEMLSNMDKFGLLQQLALGVFTHVSTAPHLCRQSQNVEYFVGNRTPDDEQDVDSMTLHANDSSQYLEYEIVLRSAGDVGICGAQYVFDGGQPWRQSAFSPKNNDMTAGHSMFHQIHAWTPNDVSLWALACFSIVGLQKVQEDNHSNHQTTIVSKYDHERMLCSGCLNMPWDPGGNHDCFVLAIAWGQAMFCGGGNVMPGTTGYMGFDVMGFRPCSFGLAWCIECCVIAIKGVWKIWKGNRKIFRNTNGSGRRSSSSLLRLYPRFPL